MSQYGYVIDNDLDFSKREVYQLFVNYFNNPILSKIKDEADHTLYGAKIGLLLRDNRYLLVSSPKDTYSVGQTFNLEDIKWSILQTRTLSPLCLRSVHTSVRYMTRTPSAVRLICPGFSVAG